MLLLMTGFGAFAEETRLSGKVELFGEGAFPKTDASVSVYDSGRLESFLVEQLLSAADVIDLSAYSLMPDVFFTLYENVLNAHPELFHVKSGFEYSLSDGGELLYIYPQYHYSGSTLNAKASSYSKALNAIVDYARKSDTDVGKLLRANDYICAHYEYDDTYSIYTAEEMLETGRGVCQAYMLVYKAVLNELGFRSASATSWPMNHTWNVVYLDDDWYHIDVTWNDPMINGRYIPLSAYHDYFLLSDEGISAADHYDWEGVSAATNPQYDQAFWRNLNQPAGMIDDLVYYSDGSRDPFSPTLYVYDLKTNEQKKLFTYDLPYEFGVYSLCHPVWPTRGNLYYAAANKLYMMPRSGGKAKVVYTASGSGNQIFYSFLNGMELNMLISDDPYDGVHRFDTFTLEDGCEAVLSASRVSLTPGQTHQLTASLVPSQGETAFTWSSSNSSAVTVDASGRLMAVKIGASLIIAACKDDPSLAASCLVKVTGDTVLTLPADTQTIAEKAFYGAAVQEVVLPEGITAIGPQAFASCGDLGLITLPDSLTSVADDAFSGTSGVTAICASEAAAQLAQQHGFTPVLLNGGLVGF